MASLETSGSAQQRIRPEDHSPPAHLQSPRGPVPTITTAPINADHVLLFWPDHLPDAPWETSERIDEWDDHVTAAVVDTVNAALPLALPLAPEARVTSFVETAVRNFLRSIYSDTCEGNRNLFERLSRRPRIAARFRRQFRQLRTVRLECTKAWEKSHVQSGEVDGEYNTVRDVVRNLVISCWQTMGPLETALLRLEELADGPFYQDLGMMEDYERDIDDLRRQVQEHTARETTRRRDDADRRGGNQTIGQRMMGWLGGWQPEPARAGLAVDAHDGDEEDNGGSSRQVATRRACAAPGEVVGRWMTEDQAVAAARNNEQRRQREANAEAQQRWDRLLARIDAARTRKLRRQEEAEQEAGGAALEAFRTREDLELLREARRHGVDV